MKHLLAILVLAALCATATAQTLKTVMVDTNGVQSGFFGTGTQTNPSLKVGATNTGFFASIGGLNAVRNGTIIWTAGSSSFLLSAPLAFSGTNAATNAATSRANLAAARAPIWAYKATNQTNSTTNFVSDTALSFTAAAKTKYLVTAGLGYEYQGGSGNMRGKFILPTNATAIGSWNEFIGALGDSYKTFISAVSITNEHKFISESDDVAWIPQQFVVVTGTNSGSVTFQFAGTTNSSSATVPAGSWLKAEVIE